jgi:PKD repeat protein
MPEEDSMHCAPATFKFIRKLSLVFGFILISIALAAHAQTTTVLQQSATYTGTIDAKIASSTPDTNKGTEASSAFLGDTSTSGLIRFAIFQSEGGPIPNNASIISATVSLYKVWGPDAVFKLNRVLKNWTQTGVTWNSTGAGQSWSTPGVFTGDILATADGQGFVDAQPPVPNTQCNVDAPPFLDSCWLNIAVTGGMQAFQSGTANYGWKLSFVSSNGDLSKAKEFFMSEAACCNREIRRPKLTIVYRSPPTAVLSVSPNPVAQGATVTFDARNTTDGGSPITNLRLQFGDGTPDVNWTDKSVTQPHVYNTANAYTATLTATNAIGASAPATQTITVTTQPNGCQQVPTANLTANPASGASPLTVNFDASGSSDTGGNCAISSLTLQYGDGQSYTWSNKNIAPPAHNYTDPPQPNYTASLTATNAAGTSAAVTRTINITNGSCIEPTEAAASGYAVPTFHSMSIYYDPGAFNGDTIYLRYRRGTDAADSWKTGHPLWNDHARTPGSVRPYKGRGSVVHLDPGTQYVFEVSTDNATWRYIADTSGGKCPATWPETANLPISPNTPPGLWTGTNQPALTPSTYVYKGDTYTRQHVLLANQSGTANGYTLYDLTGATANVRRPDGGNDNDVYPVVIHGSYIILRGLKTIGGPAGVWIDPGSHHIVIEQMEITGYGRDHGLPLNAGLSGDEAIDEDAGIKFPSANYGSILDTNNIVIQRNKIHNPAFGTHPWDTSSYHQNGAHPYGTSPIVMYPTGGQIVIRYNETYSTTDGTLGGPPDFNHFHNDGLITGGCNAPDDGCAGFIGMGPDVDIYKNLVMHYFDDGVETDGDGINTRIWKNYFDYGGASAVSTTPTQVGPVYVWRNVYNRARMWYSDNWGAERERLYMFKSGGIGTLNGGKRYIYHNTALQPSFASQGAPGPNSLGAGFGAGGNGFDDSGNDQNMQNTVTRNNIFESWYSASSGLSSESALEEFDGVNDFDYDLTNGYLSETHGYQRTVPQYQAGNGWSAWWTGKYRLKATHTDGTHNEGYDDGAVIANFNDDFVGNGPDRGAHEDGTPDMKFGPDAYGSGS